MAQVDSLELSIETSAKGAVREIDKVIGRIGKLEKALGFNVDVGGLKEATQSISEFGKEISSSLKGVSDTVTPQIKKITNTIARLANAGGKSAEVSESLPQIGQTVKKMAEDMAGAEKIDSSINRFVSSVARLASAGEKSTVVSQQLPALGGALKSMVNDMSGVGDISESANRFTQSIAQLASAGDRTGKTAASMDLLAEKTKNFFNTMKDAPEVSENTIRMTQAMAQLASAGGKAGNTAISLKTGLDSVSSVFSRINQGINRTLGSLKNFISHTKKASSGAKSFAKSIGTLAAKFWALTRAARGLADSVGKSMDYVETLNYFDAAFGQVAGNADLSQWKKLGYSSAETYANSFSERAKELTSKMTGFQVDSSGMLRSTGMQSLGIDPSLLMNYQAMFGQMSSSMGVASENALALSDALTMIGADLASVRNMDFKDVWDDMASGLTGMSRALDKYGVNIRQAALDQKLLELGINTTANELGQSDKALLRTIILLDSTRYAWGDLAETINQPANQLRLLRANLENLSRTIGNLFLPIVAKVLPYINAFVIALQRLFTWVGKILGINISGITSSIGGGAGDALGGILDDAGDLNGSLEDASAAAKKLKNNLMGIDELNIISEEDSDALGNIGAPNISGLLNDAFYDALDAYQKAWDEAFSGMENKANELADKIVEFAKYAVQPISKAWAAEGDFVVKSWEKAFTDLGSLVKSIGRDAMAVWQQEATVDVLKDVFHIIGDIGLVVSNLASNFEAAWNKNYTGLHILENIRDIIGEIIHNIRLAADYTVEWSKKLDFSPLLESIKDFTRTLANKMDDISGIFTDFYQTVILGLSKWAIGSGLPKLIGVFDDFINDIDWPKLRGELQKTWESLERFGETVGEGLIIFIDRLSDSLSNFINSKTFENFLKFLRDWMDSVSPEDVADALEKIAKAIITFKVAALGLEALKKITGVATTLKNFFNLFKKGGAATQAAETMNEAGKSMSAFGKAFQTLGVTLAVAETAFVVGKFFTDLKEWQKNIDELGWEEGRRKTGIDNPANPYRNGTAITQEDGTGVYDKWVESINDKIYGAFDSEDLKNRFASFKIGDVFTDLYKKFEIDINNQSWGSLGIHIVEGILLGIASPVIMAAEAIGKFFSWLWDGICDVFGIHSPAENMKPLGENILLGIVEGFRETFGKFGEAIEEWWNTCIAPWFTKDKWIETYDSFVTAFNEKWEELKGWWKNTKFSDWIDEYVAPFFTKDKWVDIYDSVETGLQEKWDSLVSWWESSALSKWIDNNVKPLLTKEGWEGHYKNIKESLESTWNKAVDWWKSSGASKWIDEHVKPYFTKDKWSKTYQNIKESLQDKWDELVSWWKSSTLNKWIENDVKPFFTKDGWDETYKSVRTSLEDTWDKLVSWWKSSTLSKWIENDVKPFFKKESWEKTYDSVKTSLSDKWGELVSWWKSSGVSKWINEDVKPFFKKESWEKTYDTIRSQLKDKWDSVVDWWKNNGVSKWIDEHVKPFFDKDKWTWDGIKEGLSNAWDSAIRAMKEKWNTFAEWINDKLTFEIPTVELFGRQFGGGTIDLGRIPMFAAGGIVTEPTFGMFGEAGAEAVVPLDRDSRWINNVADSVADRIGNSGRQSDELLREQNALLREQNELLMRIANKKMVAILDRRETLNGLREEANRQGYGLNTSFA